MPQAISSFEVTGWDEEAYEERSHEPRLSRATVTKRYRGDLDGEGAAELLMCQADAADYDLGAGYVASEKVSGTLLGKRGGFVMQHGGLSGGGSDPHTFGSIVPGSGTGALKGITGQVMITRDDDGKHTLTMDFTLGERAAES